MVNDPEVIPINLTLSTPVSPFNHSGGREFMQQIGPNDFHKGIDYSAYPPIYAIGNGQVRIADKCSLSDCNGQIGNFSGSVNRGYGSVVVIEIPGYALSEELRTKLGVGVNESLYALYGHLYSIQNVQPGDMVVSIQEMGIPGNTGNSYGAHLHFELRVGPSNAIQNGDMCVDASCTHNLLFPSVRYYPDWTELRVVNPDILKSTNGNELEAVNNGKL